MENNNSLKDFIIKHKTKKSSMKSKVYLQWAWPGFEPGACHMFLFETAGNNPKRQSYPNNKLERMKLLKYQRFNIH